MNPCSICFNDITDPLTLPCTHIFCRGCIDDVYTRMQAAGDNMSCFPLCRCPLFGEADRLFSLAQNEQNLSQRRHLYRECISWMSANGDLATGPNGLNRMIASATYNIARTHEVSGNFELARQSYEQAIQVHPGNSDAWCNLGSMLYRLGFVLDAKSKWSHALVLDPNDEIARSNLNATEAEMSDCTPVLNNNV